MASSMEDTLDRMLATPTSNNNDNSEKAEFVPSVSFTGPKHGYVFCTTDQFGTGYHLDSSSSTNQNDDSTASMKRKRNTNGNDKKQVLFQISNKKKKKTGEELLAEAELSLKNANTNNSNQSTRVSSSVLGTKIDKQSITKASHTLTKTISKNSLLRAQHPNDPSKFMESELALNEELEGWKNVAANVKAYPLLVELEVVNMLLASGGVLGSHENMDIVRVVLSVWNEWLDVDLLEEDEGSGGARYCMSVLGNAFISNSGLELILLSLSRMESELSSSDDDDNDNNEEEDEMVLQGMEHVLDIMETLLDLDAMGVLQELSSEKEYTSIASLVWKHTPTFVSWLLERIGRSSPKRSSSNANTVLINQTKKLQYHACELLSTLLQHEDTRRFFSSSLDDNNNDDAVKLHLSSMPCCQPIDDDDDNDDDNPKTPKSKPAPTVDGIEMLLQAIAPFRKIDPVTDTECEFLENCFDSLAASMMLPTTNNNTSIVSHFIQAQGMELMLRCISSKKHSGHGALKVLNYALSSSSNNTTSGKEAAEYLVVEAGALKVLFPLFMRQTSSIPKPAKCSDAGASFSDSNQNKSQKKAHKAKKNWMQQIESNTIHILYSFVRFLTWDSPMDAKERLLAKFLENDCEKCDRCIELLLKYDTKARMAEAKYIRSEEAEITEEAEGVHIMDLAAFSAKLKGGGELFHRVGTMLGFICLGSKRCHTHVLEMLRVKNSGIGVVKAALEEFASVLDEGEQQTQLEDFLDKI